MLQGIKMKAPWDCQDAFYPPPDPALPRMHYFTSIVQAMKDSRNYNELDDCNEDSNYEEISEPEKV